MQGPAGQPGPGGQRGPNVSTATDMPYFSQCIKLFALIRHRPFTLTYESEAHCYITVMFFLHHQTFMHVQIRLLFVL